jgi:hypothetical protein
MFAVRAFVVRIVCNAYAVLATRQRGEVSMLSTGARNLMFERKSAAPQSICGMNLCYGGAELVCIRTDCDEVASLQSTVNIFTP